MIHNARSEVDVQGRSPFGSEPENHVRSLGKDVRRGGDGAVEQIPAGVDSPVDDAGLTLV